jgi:hypothetical protein
LKFASGIKHVDVATPKSVAGPQHVFQVFSQWPPAFASPALLYQLLNIYNPATIYRFHMTTQRPLSAAAPAPPAQSRLAPGFARRIQWHRFILSLEGHSCLPRGGPQPTKSLRAVAKPGTQPIEAAAALPVYVLIANLELEFNPSHRKLSPLEIPNRKFLTISNHFSQPFASLRSSSLITHHSPLIPAFLIHGAAIKIPPNPLKT